MLAMFTTSRMHVWIEAEIRTLLVSQFLAASPMVNEVAPNTERISSWM